MNNKGQVLVVFIILLPIIFMIFTFVIDLGLLYIEKKELDSVVENSLDYYINNKDVPLIEEKVENLIYKNVDDINNLEIDNNELYFEITIEKEYKSLYSLISNSDNVLVSYKIYKDDNRIVKG